MSCKTKISFYKNLDENMEAFKRKDLTVFLISHWLQVKKTTFITSEMLQWTKLSNMQLAVHMQKWADKLI